MDLSRKLEGNPDVCEKSTTLAKRIADLAT